MDRPRRRVSSAGRRLRDAYVNQMGNRCAFRRRHGGADRNQVHLFELVGSTRIGMRRADQMNERVARLQRGLHGDCIEGIADDRCRACSHAPGRLFAREHTHAMAMRNQDRNQMSADVAGTSGDKNINGRCHDATKSKQSPFIELIKVRPSEAIHYSAARNCGPPCAGARPSRQWFHCQIGSSARRDSGGDFLSRKARQEIVHKNR